MTDAMPQRTREYRNHHLDSTRWDHYAPRSGDIVISTSLKAGTTWMQRIVSLLLFGPDELPTSLWMLSPWIDQRFVEPVEPVIERIEAQEHRRFLKTHLALDGLPYHPEVRYLFVARDTRDVFMSLWNHYRSYNDFVYGLMNTDPPGDPLPRCDGDLGALWRSWITRGWFDWEDDGWPFWSHHHHASTWWEWRHLPNVLPVHYNDLLADLEGEMRRVANFLDVEIDDEAWPQLVEKATFATMKSDADRLLPETAFAFEGGPQQFVHKGVNGRWREVLSDDDLALYETCAARTLAPDLRTWLESGRLASEGALPTTTS